MSTKKQIGRIPISKGKYVAGQTYNRLSQVTLYGSTYQSMIDDNTSVPAILDDNGNVQHANTDQWLVIADGREAYNAGERTSCFSMEENPEYLAVETDAEGKVLAYTGEDGSHYAHNMKSETIDAKQDKEDGKGLIDNGVAEVNTSFEDPEERMNIETDSDGKILAYRDKDGVNHEHELEAKTLHVSSLNLKGNSVNDIQSALIANGFNVKNPMDRSESSYIQIPIPRCAQLNLLTDIMPTAKSGMGISGVTCDIPCYAEFWDMQGNYFKIPILLSAQGNSSMSFIKKNLALDLFSDKERKNSYAIKFGDWVSQDSFHLKAYYTDFFRGVGAVSYMLYEEMAKTRSINDDRPYKAQFASKYSSKDDGIGSIQELNDNMNMDAKCFPQAFPVSVYQNNVFYGVYSWQLKKHRDNMHHDKKNAKHIHLDGTLNSSTIFGGTIDWTQFEVRNPKNLYMQIRQQIKGVEQIEYNGDYPKELMGTDSNEYNQDNKDMKRCATVKKYIQDFSTRLGELKQAETNNKDSNEIKSLIEKYFSVSFLIDYILETNLVGDGDGYGKNWQWTTYDGIQWVVNPYDHDCIFGAYDIGNYVGSPNATWIGNSMDIPTGWIIKYYLPEIKARWKSLRDNDIFSAENISRLLEDWCSRIGYENWKMEYDKWNESPCNRPSLINKDYWERSTTRYLANWNNSIKYSVNSLVCKGNKAYKSLINNNLGNDPSTDDGSVWADISYMKDKSYVEGDICYYGKTLLYGFKCLKACVAENPLTGFYENFPQEMGHFDSIFRVKNWITERLSYMDKILEYNN